MNRTPTRIDCAPDARSADWLGADAGVWIAALPADWLQASGNAESPGLPAEEALAGSARDAVAVCA